MATPLSAAVKMPQAGFQVPPYAPVFLTGTACFIVSGDTFQFSDLSVSQNGISSLLRKEHDIVFYLPLGF